MVFTQVHIMKYVYSNLYQFNLTRLNISSFQKEKSSTYQTQTDNFREQEPKKRSESHCLVDCVGHLVGFDKLDSVDLLCLTAECERRMKVLLQWKVRTGSCHSSTQMTSANHSYFLPEDNEQLRGLLCHP